MDWSRSSGGWGGLSVEERRSRVLGYSFGVGTALCWAISAILIAKALVGLPSALWGVAVGLGAAALVNLFWVLRERRGARLRAGGGGLVVPWLAVRFMLLAGLFLGFGTFARAEAINLAPVVVAVPLTQTASFFTPMLSRVILGRRVEHVPLRLIIGAVLIVGGSALVILGLNR